MGSEVIILPIIFGALFGVAYLFFSTRNKERLALIEKGADASIFVKGGDNRTPAWKIILINLAMLLIATGLAIFIASLMVEIGMDEDVAYPGTIFTMTGIGLFVGYTVTKKLSKTE